MRDDVVIGLGIAALVVMPPRKAIDWGAGWVFPVPDAVIGGRTFRAQVTSEFRPPDRPDHYGVDVMYRDGGKRYFAPVGVPVLAARSGKVWSVRRGPRGIAVVVDHGKPFATFYQHLSAVSVRKGQPLSAGDPLGTMGFDPTDKAKLLHLHFAAWLDGSGDAASVDPVPAMRVWPHKTWEG